VHELGREQPKTTKELLNIATRHASGKEAVMAVFVQNGGKAATGSGRGASTIAADKGTKRSTKSDKRGPRQRTQLVMAIASYDEDNNNKGASDSDEELVAIAEHDFKHQARPPVDNFEKLLEATSPNHTYSIKHKLMKCTMMKNYMTTGNLSRNRKPEGDSTGKAATPFP
jgi:hypothetical protein